MSNRFAAFRQALEEKRVKTIQTLADLADDLEQPFSESISEFALYDNHPADVATETYERGKDLALRAEQEHMLREIEAALRRISSGTYGFCTICGQPIAEDRLRALPYASCCQHCQKEKPQRPAARPQSEPLIDSMLRQSFTDDTSNENVAFDGEDTWQALGRYGTSNTPGDFRQAAKYDEILIDQDESIGIVFPEEALPLSYDQSRRHLLRRGRDTGYVKSKIRSKRQDE